MVLCPAPGIAQPERRLPPAGAAVRAVEPGRGYHAVAARDGRVLLVTTGGLRGDAFTGPAFPEEETPY